MAKPEDCLPKVEVPDSLDETCPNAETQRSAEPRRLERPTRPIYRDRLQRQMDKQVIREALGILGLQGMLEFMYRRYDEMGRHREVLVVAVAIRHLRRHEVAA